MIMNALVYLYFPTKLNKNLQDLAFVVDSYLFPGLKIQYSSFSWILFIYLIYFKFYFLIDIRMQKF